VDRAAVYAQHVLAGAQRLTAQNAYAGTSQVCLQGIGVGEEGG
jgi:hypothetical protein